MYIKRSVFYHAIIQMLLCSLVAFYIFFDQTWNAANPDLEAYIGLISIISLCNFFFSISRTCKEYFSIAVLFVVFMYLFNLGIPISRFLGWINDETELFLSRRVYIMGYDTFFEYTAYCFILISGLQLGVLMRITSIKRHIADEEKLDNRQKLYECSFIAKVCMLIGIVPYLVQEFLLIRASMANAYQSFEIDLSGTGLGLISSVFVLGVFLQLVAWQKESRKFDFLMYVFGLFQIIRMFVTGDRSTGITILLLILLIRHRFVKPLNSRKSMLYIACAYLGMLGIKAIELTRSSLNSDMGEVIRELFQSNMLVETINEYGGNVWSGMMVYYSVPRTGSYRYGLTYLAAIVGKPLMILGISSEVWKFSDYANFINDPARGSIIEAAKGVFGGSFSGEWYFNFGFVGLILIIPFGYLLGTFSDACMDKNKHPILTGYLMYVGTLVIWWVRQYFPSVSWISMFLGVVLGFIWLLFKKRLRTRDYWEDFAQGSD